VAASKLPPQPQFSLPTPQSLTPKGWGAPFAARSRPSVVGRPVLQYSSQSHSSCGVPLPTLPARYGSAPI
jgi:hypothetical protein